MHTEAILSEQAQAFIQAHEDENVSELVLKYAHRKELSYPILIRQIEALQKVKTKIPEWYANKKIIYPVKLSVEQSSSEITAKYKAEIIKGDTLWDFTGGLGVDAYFLSKTFSKIRHTEINAELSGIVAHNFKMLGASNIEVLQGDAIELLEQKPEKFSWIYLDPARRKEDKKVFEWEDCTPDILKILPSLFEQSDNICIKSSPLMDIRKGASDLNHLAEIHITAVDNDCKEILWILKKNVNIPIEQIPLFVVHFQGSEKDVFQFTLAEEVQTKASFTQVLNFLYEPNSALMKSGAYNLIANKFNLYKLHPNSHLYTSNDLVKNFPGRTFVVHAVYSLNKKELSENLPELKANITVRNASKTVADIRKSYKIKDGGDHYLFYTTVNDRKEYIVHCFRVPV